MSFFRRCVRWAVLCLAVQARGQALDSFIASPQLWQTPRAAFVEQNKGLGFYWLSSSRDRAETHMRGLTLFSQPVWEVDAGFAGEKLSSLTISIYNRGDAGDISFEKWSGAVLNSVNGLNAMTKAQGNVLGQEASNAVKAYGVTWQTPATQYLLEYSRTKEVKSLGIPFRAEFIRLQITPAEKPKSFMEEALASVEDTPSETWDGPSHVKHGANGDVLIDSVPMVDQGQKGYCVVAAAERVLRYYGMRVDENELAELANSSATEGTSYTAMFDSLQNLAQRLRVRVRPVMNMNVAQFLSLLSAYNELAQAGSGAQKIPIPVGEIDLQAYYAAMKPDILKEARTRNESDMDLFRQKVHDLIDQGTPGLWSVILGIVPEKMMVKGIGGHMRLIIGYNDQTNEILYTDSWGPGNELKRMPLDNAWTITTGLNAIEPL
ncbi:MAG: C39 family peptidase [Chthoniobacteraceae bacterium]|jgi:hypothetical protein